MIQLVVAISLFASPAATSADTEVPAVEAGRDTGDSENRDDVWWSFAAPRRQARPTVKDEAWCQSHVDAFVLAALERRGLTPSPKADRRQLLRRASFDLTGLPPAPEELAKFLGDDHPEAFEYQVDRLLASPQFGERWGRVWLDLARYSDTTAEWLKSIAQAYHYRDWVVQAINSDVSYDSFIKRQLATDKMDETDHADLAALGFLGLSPRYWKELRLSPDVIKTVVAEEWEERIDTVSRTFLGLTVACARCHDHKFDPVSMHDYYALAGVFASTRLVDRKLLAKADADRVQQAVIRVQTLEKEIAELEAGDANDAAKRIDQLRTEIKELQSSTPHYHAPTVHAVEDASLHVLPDGADATKLIYKDAPRDLPLQLRGNPATTTGDVIPRRFLSVLLTSTPRPFQRGSGRLELAEAIANEGAPLASRVIVNRVWRHLFGRGLVTTPGDFGRQGAPPSHPELLDDLAVRFVTDGWSIKRLFRELMLSAAYQQMSRSRARESDSDPQNRWLWRMNPKRLDVESWRDAVLAVSGSLDERQGGPPLELAAADNQRRTIYGRIARRDLAPMLKVFDFPDPTAHSPARSVTTTPLQQLLVFNSGFIRDQAAALAARLRREFPGDERAQIERAYQLLFGRTPAAEEHDLAATFLTSSRDPETPTQDRLARYAHVLLGSNEFLFVD